MGHSKTGQPPGRPRTPARIVALQGGRVAPQPVVRAAPADPPADLSPAAAVFWKTYARELVEPLTVLDVPAFAELAELHALLKEAHRIIASEGSIVEGQRGSTRHPAHLIVGQVMPLWASLAAQFGFSPQARLKMAPVARPANSSNDLLSGPLYSTEKYLSS